ncbi:MAG: type II toxin-antitoxin system RelE/ParE family toxin [Vicinamibacterales bacterium]
MRRLIVEPRAEREIAVASKWWHSNRQKAPSAFDDDVAAAIDEVRLEPGLGVSIAGTKRPKVRRVTLQRVRYYIYYRVDEEDSLVVLAVRHTSRLPPRGL